MMATPFRNNKDIKESLLDLIESLTSIYLESGDSSTNELLPFYVHLLDTLDDSELISLDRLITSKLRNTTPNNNR